MRKGTFVIRVVLVVAAVMLIQQTQGQTITVGQAFSYMCYRRQPVVNCITRSKAWRDGRRDILDWGCGGGFLSLDLVRLGANNVVAIDLDDTAVERTKQRLASFSNAMARRPQLASEILFGRKGYIGYRNRFDIVVSYKGATSDGSAGHVRDKIAAQRAMDCSVRACRAGGQVIVADLHSLRDVRRLRGRVSHYRAMMKRAGLVDVKVDARLCFRPLEAMLDIDVLKQVVRKFNMRHFPVVVLMFQGTKKQW